MIREQEGEGEGSYERKRKNRDRVWITSTEEGNRKDVKEQKI